MRGHSEVSPSQSYCCWVSYLSGTSYSALFWVCWLAQSYFGFRCCPFCFQPWTGPAARFIPAIPFANSAHLAFARAATGTTTGIGPRPCAPFSLID